MKVSELPYKRYTIEEGKAEFEKFKTAFTAAKSADEALEAKKIFLDLFIEYQTAASLSHARYSINTNDEFYQAEVEYYDQNDPLFSQLQVEYGQLMLDSPFRKEMEKKINPRIFKMFEISAKTFSPEIIPDLQLENSLVTEYSTFMSKLEFEYDGKKMPLSILRGQLEDKDREVRKKTAEAIGKGLEAHSEELDGFYDKLVKVRDTIAKKLGYKNFVELGYYRMGRLDYNAEMVRTFRENVKKSLVPVVSKVKAELAGQLGWDKVNFYDDSIYSAGESPKPILDKAGIFRAAQEMYDGMDKNVGKFMAEMQAAEAFDVDSHDGKMPGGYCTGFAKYKQPFIFANFNGSSDDIDVITHEFGHALAANFVFNEGDLEIDVGGMETAECHSMSMEFFCWKFIDKFFGKNADKYKKRHLLSCLSFIPYGCIVDEYQHIVYEHPEMTPAERNAAYKKLEETYRPYMNWEGITYLEKGTRWQYQTHIFEVPFYYIDYCLAQTVALNFLTLSVKDYESAFAKYIEFARTGGQMAFGDLVTRAGIASPFTDGSLDVMAENVLKISDGI